MLYHIGNPQCYSTYIILPKFDMIVSFALYLRFGKEEKKKITFACIPLPDFLCEEDNSEAALLI